MRSKVVLFFPGKNWAYGIDREFPALSIISVGNFLEKNGVECQLVDIRNEDYTKANLDNTAFVGISSLTGNQISVGLEIAKWVRDTDNSIPIVWGGIHPSLLPYQTLENSLVDIIVRGEGEETALELAKKIKNGKPINNIRGISYKKKSGIIKHNEERPFMKMDDVLDVSYHLIKNSDAYKPSKMFHYTSSRGCPHRCTFCYNTQFCHSRWRTKSDKKIHSELKYIIDTYKPEMIEFCEDNFFVSKKRVEAVCKFLISEDFSGVWTADCRIDYFKNYDSEFLKLLVKSGCNNISVGVESGSQRILDYVQKDITVKEAVDAAKKCAKFGISFFNLFMIGFPTETRKEVYETIFLIDLLEKINPKSTSIISSFSPYPGTKLYNIALSMGFKQPKDLEEWGRWIFSSKENINWLSKEDADFLEKVAMISRVRKIDLHKPRSINELFKYLSKLPFSIDGNMRWKERYFNHAYEWILWKKIQRIRGYF
jgi:radical SAM superfamily enzyme YgiQ (UPF0313 family)